MTCEECKYHSYVNSTHFCDSQNHKRKTVRIDAKEALKDIDCKWAESGEERGMSYGNGELPNGGWIPVSERLPEKTGWYLITFKTANVVAVCELSYLKNENYWTDKDISKKVFDNNDVIAWMPFPIEPYNESLTVLEGSEE